MRTRGTMGRLAALALGLALAVTPAWADPGLERTRQEPASLGRVWEAAAAWIAGGWQAVVAEVMADRGAYIDPNGAVAGSDSDRGAHTDPNG